MDEQDLFHLLIMFKEELVLHNHEKVLSITKFINHIVRIGQIIHHASNNISLLKYVLIYFYTIQPRENI